jgi:osmotically-inducible protein OsmY
MKQGEIMKRHTMFLVLALAMMFAYASAKAQMGGNPGGQQPGMQSPNNPNNPNSTLNRPDMGAPDNSTNPQNQQPNPNTAKVSDSDLQNAVKSKLASDPAFANVQAAVSNGKVTLEGTVNSKDDKKKAKNAVKSIAGVRGVKETLIVSGKESEKAPKSSSAAGPGMSFLGAQDAAQSNASQNTAGSIAGNSQTSANPSSTASQTQAPEAGSMTQSGMTPAGASGDMTPLQKQIETSIKNNASLADSSVSVNVSENAIDLNGTVGSNKAKMDAERIAQSYAQNRKVNDNLQVTGAGNSDLNNGHSAMSNGPTTTPH